MTQRSYDPDFEAILPLLPTEMDLSSVEIVTEPRHGSVKIDTTTGAVSYQAGPHGPQVEFDELWYTVRDELSNVSTARRVRIQF